MQQFSLAGISEPDIPEPLAPLEVSDERRRELNIFKQAMPLSRLLGNGLEFADAWAMHDMADRGIAWADAGEWLGERNLRRARMAQEAGHVLSARSFFRNASACFRFGQISLPGESERKRDMYRRLIESFAAAGSLDTPPTRKVEIPYRGGALCGWLLLPPGIEAPPVVIVVGGLDGWKEEYHSGAQYLVERGIAALLMDAPGQGETRLFHRLYLTPDVTGAFSHLVDFLLSDARVGTRVGIWGNSFGGLLAAWAASTDSRIQAICVNGSPARPAEGLDSFPPLTGIAGALIGTTDPEKVRAVLRQLTLTPEANRIECALLQLHGALDLVCPLEIARPICEDAPGVDRQIIIWQDGVHCVYNHSHEKHSIMADWFHDRLC
jgi:dienelactone hydrolase